MLRFCARACIAILAGLVAMTAVLIAGVAWRLTTAPLAVEFLTPYFEDLLADGFDGRLAFDIQGTALVWDGFEQPLLIRAESVSIADADGRRIAAIPALALGLETRRLIAGEIRPTDLFVDANPVPVIRLGYPRVTIAYSSARFANPLPRL